MLKISYRNQFKKELKQQENRGKDLKKFLKVAEKLVDRYKNNIMQRPSVSGFESAAV